MTKKNKKEKSIKYTLSVNATWAFVLLLGCPRLKCCHQPKVNVINIIPLSHAGRRLVK